jgi:hypothetical protein
LNLLRLFRRRPSIADAAALADFIDRQAAFLAQKGIYEYSRARAGRYAEALFREQGFLAAVERSRWQAYPLGLAMVAELVDGALLPFARDRATQLAALQAIVLAVFDRYPVPTVLAHSDWRAQRTELARRLELIGMHAPKSVIDICEPWAASYCDLMPIHAKLRGRDFPTIRNYLRATLCNFHDDLIKRMDARALADMLAAKEP